VKQGKRFLTLAAIVCSLGQLSMTNDRPTEADGTLNEEDRAIAEGQDRPILHSVAGDSVKWESYGQWLCFPMADLEDVDCRDEKSDQAWDAIDAEEREGKGYFAVMNIDHEGRRFRFEPPGWTSDEACLQKIDETKRLFEGMNSYPLIRELGGVRIRFIRTVEPIAT
jgi:hypothetical protein